MLTINVRPESRIDTLWHTSPAPSCEEKLSTLACALLKDLSAMTVSLMGLGLGYLGYRIFWPLLYDPEREYSPIQGLLVVPMFLATMTPTLQTLFHLSTQWRNDGAKQVTFLSVHLLHFATLLHGSAFTPLASRVTVSLPPPIRVACSAMEIAIPIFILLRGCPLLKNHPPAQENTEWKEITERVLLFLNALRQEDSSWNSFLSLLEDYDEEAYLHARGIIFACALRFGTLPSSLKLSAEESALQKRVQELSQEDFSLLLVRFRNGRKTATPQAKEIRDASLRHLPLQCRPYDHGIQAWKKNNSRRTPCEQVVRKARKCAKEIALFFRGLVTFPWVQAILYPRTREES